MRAEKKKSAAAERAAGEAVRLPLQGARQDVQSLLKFLQMKLERNDLIAALEQISSRSAWLKATSLPDGLIQVAWAGAALAGLRARQSLRR
ncbi:MAG: hypothetical protein R2991_04500 [Thermoanaerobaculia bacterium]